MTDVLAFLFSPCGCVGRGAWWLTQLLTILLLVGLLIVVAIPCAQAKKIADQRTGYGNIPVLKLTPSERVEEGKQIEKELAPEVPKLLVVGIVLLMVLWWNSVIEIKRWHDLGMSGFLYLLRFVAPFLHGFPTIALCWGLVYGIGAFILLGCCSGMYAPQAPYRRDDFQAPAARGDNSGALLVLVLLVVAVGGAVWATRTGYISTTSLLALVSPAATQDTPSTEDEAIYRGTADTNYAKDWVVIDGEKLTGITSVLVAPKAKVCLVYSEGGKSVPVSSLPQGFLDAWKITSAQLKAADAP